jgi:hypothetical protein
LLLLLLLLWALKWLQQLKVTVMVRHPASHQFQEALLPLLPVLLVRLLLLVCASLPGTAAAEANEEAQRGSGGHDVNRDPGKPHPLPPAAAAC